MVFKKGNVPWNKNIPCNEETKRKISSANKGKKGWNKGKKWLRMQGEKNPNYKGGGIVNCPVCNKAFWVTPYEKEIGRKYCSRSCFAKTRIGEKNSFYGKKHTKETMKKQSTIKMAEKNPMFGKTRPKKIREKISKTKKGKLRPDICGEKNPAWKGGYKPYYGANWTQQRRLTRKRDNYTCQKCGIQENDREHDVHHIIPFQIFGLERYKEANSLDNLITLCMSCHRKLNGGDK